MHELEAEEERSEDEYKELVSDHARFLDSLKLVKQDEELKAIKKRLRQALAELQAKYELGQAYDEASRLEDEALALAAIADLSGSKVYKECAELRQAVISLKQRVKKLPKKEGLLTLMSKLEPLVEALANRCAAEDSKKSKDAPAPIISNSKERYKLSLPTFSGKMLEWRRFWRRFRDMLGKVELEDSEKIQQLLEAMKSPADASLVEKVSEKG